MTVSHAPFMSESRVFAATAQSKLHSLGLLPTQKNYEIRYAFATGLSRALYFMAGPTKKEITNRAYEIWEQNGRPEGRDEEFWKQAEKELSQGMPELGDDPGRRESAPLRLPSYELGTPNWADGAPERSCNGNNHSMPDSWQSPL